MLATEIYNGKDADFSEIKKCLETSIDDVGDDYEYITSDVGELVEQLKDNTRFKFNLKPLQERVHGVGDGNLVIIFARPRKREDCVLGKPDRKCKVLHRKVQKSVL